MDTEEKSESKTSDQFCTYETSLIEEISLGFLSKRMAAYFPSRNLSSSIMRKGFVPRTLGAIAPKRRLSHAGNDIFHTSLVPTLLQNGLPHKM
jgi:hypothetical protein